MKYKGEKNNTIETLIGVDVHIVGDVTCEKDIKVEGSLKGNITCKNKVIIGPKGQFNGNIEAKSVTIYGKVEGNIKVQETLEVMETGELYGEFETMKLYVALGGMISGQSKMKKSELFKNPLEKI